MAVELQTLYNKVKHMDIVLEAGSEGLSGMVTWVHMVEANEATSFLEGGEIAFCTGIGLNNGLSLIDLVENIWKHNASGVVLNTGPFLEHIPDEVIDFGKMHGFPIFSVPWKTHLAEIMRIFTYDITKSEQTHIEIAAAFKNAIFFPKQEELYLVPLSQHGFKLKWTYSACVFRIVGADEHSIPGRRLETYCMELNTHLHHRKYKQFAVFHYEHQVILIASNSTEETIHQMITDVQNYLNVHLKTDEHYYIGIGKPTKSLRCLHKSYRQAQAIYRLQSKHKIDSSMISYSHMGIYKLLLGIDDMDIIQEYYEKTILPLYEYDKKNNSELCAILRAYLEHDCSVKDAAEELFVHRNTVNYSLTKIGELLDINLSSLDTRLQLKLGLMLENMF